MPVVRRGGRRPRQREVGPCGTRRRAPGGRWRTVAWRPGRRGRDPGDLVPSG